MKHQIMFSLICLSTLFLNNVFAAETCNYINNFVWGYQCTDTDIPENMKIIFAEQGHSDSDEACKNANLNKGGLSVCVSGNFNNYTYYNDQRSNGLHEDNHCYTVGQDDYCYTAYFYNSSFYDPPTYNPNSTFGVGALSNYDDEKYKYTGIKTKDEIYKASVLSGYYDIETRFDRALEFPERTGYSGTYEPVYKTKKIALIFSDFDINGKSIKEQCNDKRSKCYMVICDFGNPDACVAPEIKDVGEKQNIKKNDSGNISIPTGFITSSKTFENIKKRYTITPGEKIPLETLNAIMDEIVKIYNQGDSSKQQQLKTYRLTDFTIDWQECQENHYCDEDGQHECPYGMKSEAGSDEITDCYIDEDTQLCDSTGCITLDAGTKAYYTKGSD